MGQQTCGWDAFVDHLGWYRCLDQCFALTAGPFPTHMLFDGEHTWRVIQFLADVLADALKLATASALSVFWFVMNDGTWKLRRQGRALWFLARYFWSRSRKQCRQLGVDSLKIGVKKIVEQAALLRTDLLAALGKPVPLEDRDLVGQLFDNGLITVVLSAHGVDLRHQLRSECTQLVGGHLVEVGHRSHAVDFTKADRLRQRVLGLITAF
ncbi:hypothetical protein AN403_4756 [Pseudomonas fluorescens]|uniref:Uncharacterized protein n=1 Tax=Pseudomonas fluorescens TaxID=294 RepID=A0A0P8XJH3_PSEFL|nr:hypothetical protein AN403_4756 [Pseudomonas fluorescens]